MLVQTRRLIYVVTEDWFFVSHFLDRALAAISEGYEVILASRFSSHQEFLSKCGINCVNVNFDRSSLNLFKELRTILELYYLYRRLRPSIVHHVAAKPILYGTLAALLSGARSIVNATVGMGYVFSSSDRKAKLLRPLLEIGFRLLLNPKTKMSASRVIFENIEDLTQAVNCRFVRAEECELIQGAGVNLSLFHPTVRVSTTPVVIFGARMLRDKGVVEFVESAKHINSTSIVAKFILAGDIDEGNPTSVSRAYLSSVNGTYGIEWQGWQANMASVMENADIACLPSYREGLPKFLLEACACGLPIVTTDTVGCREIVTHGVNGFLVPVGDSIELSRAILQLIGSTELRKLMGSRNRKSAVELYSTETICAKTLCLYSALLHSTSHPIVLEDENSLSRKRLLFIVNVDWFFLSHRLPIAVQAKKEGFDVHVATKVTEDFDSWTKYGITLHPLNISRNGIRLGALIYSVFQVLKIVKSVKPDVLHLVTIPTVLIGMIAARIFRVPKVIVALSGLGILFISEGFFSDIRRHIVGLLLKIGFKHSNLISIFQNADDYNTVTKLTGLSSSKARMIPGSGVNLSKFCPSPFPTGIPVILFAARLVIEKGIFEFVDAIRILKSRNVAFRAVVAGRVDEGSHRKLSENQILSWTNEGLFEYLGYLQNMSEVIGRSTIVVLPSYREGVPKLLMEAAACGRPVVSTNVPGCRDAVLNNITGLLVEKGNSVELADAIERLLINRVILEEMSMAARKHAILHFSETSVVSAQIDLYLRN